MMRKSLVVLAVSAALTIAAFAAPDSGKQPAAAMKVGDFAVMVSQAIGAPATTPQSAVANLQARGLRLPLDLGADLTENQVVSMFRELGITNVRTENPNGQVTPGRAEALLGGVNLSALSAQPVPSADLPTECLQVKNRGTCVECCKFANGCVDQSAQCDFARSCAKFCKAVLPPGKQSPSEPEP